MTRRNRTEKQECRPTTCVGCGSAASGYHYEAPSCCSCKTFFRRAVMEERHYQGCPKNGACAKNKSLQSCRVCRLDRCLNGGMNPLFLLTLKDPDRNPVVQKFLRVKEDLERSQQQSNRRDYGCQPSTSSKEETNTSGYEKPTIKLEKDNLHGEFIEPLTTIRPLSIECKSDKIMIDMLLLEDAHDRLRKSAYCPRFVEGLTIDEFFYGPSKLGIEFEPMRIQPFHPSLANLLVSELIIKHKICIDLSDFDYTTKKLWLFQDVVYAIEFIKALPRYHGMEDSSKRALIASALACSNFTAAFYSYSHHSDRTLYPDGGTMSWSSAIQSQGRGTCRVHTNIIATIREAKMDRREYTLLKRILTLNPLLNGLAPNDGNMLQNEREKYAKMLFSYVLAKHGIKEGPSIFVKLLSIIDVVTKITDFQKSQHILIIAMGLYKHRVPFAETIYHS